MEEQRKGRQSQKGTQQGLGCGHGKRAEEEVGEVSPVINNSKSEGRYLNCPQLEMRQNPSPGNPWDAGDNISAQMDKQYFHQALTMRSQLGTERTVIFGDTNHKVAELFFLTNREREEQGQRDAGPKPGDFGTNGEAVNTS